MAKTAKFAPMKVVRFRGRRIRCLLSACVVIALTTVYFEPFQERFEGKTKGQWLRTFSNNEQVDEKVVEAFHTNAVSFLVGVIDRKQTLGNWKGHLREALNIGRNAPGGGKPSEMLAAGTWLSWLAAKGHRVSDPRMRRISLWLDQHDDDFFAPRQVQLSLTTPHEAAYWSKQTAVSTNEP
jgi:hypothetical protein